MVTAFCHQLGWKNMEMLISQFQDRLQFGIHSELLDLMKLPSLNGVRARTLFNAGFETIASIASAESNVIENILHKSVPFQSEKEREGDDDVEVRKRNKMKNIWITGYCGLTARQAAENLILEARKFLIHEIGGAEIKWKNINSSDPIIHTENSAHPSNKSSVNERCDSIQVKEFSETKKDHPYDVSKNNKDIEISRFESLNKVIADENVVQHVPLLADDISNLYQNHTNDDREKNGNVSLQISSNINFGENGVKQKVDAKIIKSPSKQDLIWDSLNFTDAVFDNISKLPVSDNILSPNISFGSYSNNSDIVNNQNIVSTSVSSKDISLFSFDGNNSSIFEDTLPLDLLPNTIMDNNKTENNKENISDTTTIKENNDNINTESIINCFKSSILDIDDDENFTLVYEEEKRIPVEKNSKLNISQENEIGNTQEFKEMPLKTSFISPLKRHAVSNKHCLQSSPKKVKKSMSSDVYLGHNLLQIGMSKKSEYLELKIAKNVFKCYILREDDICKNFSFVENTKEFSIFFNAKTNDDKGCINMIGSNILGKTKNVSENIQNNVEEVLLIQGIAFYCSNLCLYLDLNSIKRLLPTFRLKLKQLFSNASLKLRMLSVKTNILHIKKMLKKDLLAQCVDITIAEWLLDSDERVSSIVDLTKKYCNIDLCNVEIFVNNEKKSFNKLDSHVIACLKAWCIWNITKEQVKSLEKFHFIKNTLDIETQVSKILADCEYNGITVDKDLASQLLIDVKNSQEVMQKKAFKLCGYNFNFNSSKDVAKVLGLYEGRKVSTKKSVLTSHNSTMASIVIYWRKLNSILTKTLYPLTHKAVIYSSDNS